jgi:tRNA threonylcarbamoyladenosine biosynthesis protein TsaB
MFGPVNWQGDEILVPMIDARRMEVFTAAYDFALNEVVPAGPLIIDESSFAELLNKGKVYFMGDGAAKAVNVIKHPNARFIEGILPMAKDMLALSEKAFRDEDFLDIAYSVPKYLKEYQTTTPKNKFNL